MTQEIFQNSQIDLGLLPAAGHIVWRPLEPGYRRLLLLSSAFTCAVLIALVSITLPFTGVPFWIPLAAVGLIIVLTVLNLVAIIIGFPHKGYAVRTHDVLYRSGWLYKKQIAVPINRVQHVDIRQGVFERAFGLFKINIYTAGGDSSDIAIPGLREADARRLKEYILKETAWVDEEE